MLQPKNKGKKYDNNNNITKSAKSIKHSVMIVWTLQLISRIIYY